MGCFRLPEMQHQHHHLQVKYFFITLIAAILLVQTLMLVRLQQRMDSLELELIRLTP